MPTAALKVVITILTDVFVAILWSELLLAMDTESLIVGHRCQLLSISIPRIYHMGMTKAN
jgi:hypothetical protein